MKKFAALSLAICVLAACGKTEDNARKEASSLSPPVAAQQPVPQTPQPASVDRSQYKLVVSELTSTFSEQDWKKYHQNAVDLVSHSSVTTPDVMAALEYPEYAKLSNPFDKDNFKKSHQADLAIAKPSEQKVKLVVKGASQGYLQPGDPLHGVYKGSLIMNSGSSFSYRLEPDSVSYVLRRASDNMNDINFQRTVSEDQAKLIESKIKRDNEGRGYSIPLIIYGTVVGTNVSYAGNGGQIIEIDVIPDAVDLADKVGTDAKPILQALAPDSNNQ